MSNCLTLGDPLDLTVVTTAIQKIEARKELWKLKTQYSAWIQEWRQLVFSKASYMKTFWQGDKGDFGKSAMILCVCECIFILILQIFWNVNFQFVVSQAQEKVDMWQQQAVSLTRTIPTHDAVLQETLRMLESFSCHLAVMDKLWSPTLKDKHRRTIFQGQRLHCVINTWKLCDAQDI